MVFQIIIHQTHLLKQLEDNLRKVVIGTNNMEGLLELLLQIFSLVSLHFKDIECYFTHLNCTQFGRVRIGNFTIKAAIISFINLLFCNDVLSTILVID